MPDSIKTTRISFVVAAGLAFATAALLLFIFISGAALIGWGTERSSLLGSALLGAAGIFLAAGFRRLRDRRPRYRLGHRQRPALGPDRRHRHGHPAASSASPSARSWASSP